MEALYAMSIMNGAGFISKESCKRMYFFGNRLELDVHDCNLERRY